MKKTLLYAAMASILFATSCKETLNPIIISNANDSDTSYDYVDTVVSIPQTKRILVEELTGVKCPNCGEAAAELQRLNKDVYSGQLSIVAVHTGSLTDPIEGKSIQDFRTKDGEYIASVWGPLAAKPSAVIDRLKLGDDPTYPMFARGSRSWQPAIDKARADYPATPINLTVTSDYNSEEKRYDITAIVKYTEAVTDYSALHIFITENKIIDVQQFSNRDSLKFEFSHVFRKAVTNPETGKLILENMVTKEAGRVWVFKTSFKIDLTDEKQKFWQPENMHVIAFVSTAKNADDKRVLQVQETTLK